MITDTFQKDRWKILAVVVLSTFMATLDASIVNVALPVMAEKLQTGIDGIQWVVTSYLLVITSFILTFGKISDRIGKSTVFLTGFIVFGFGSLFCALSSTLLLLVVARIVQAIGAAMFMSSNQGIVAAVFPLRERGKALGLIGSTVAVGTMTGPPFGGFLVDLFNWQTIFIINVPVSAVGLILGLFILPKEIRQKEHKPFDYTGSILLTTGIGLVFWALLSLHGSPVQPTALFSAVSVGLLFILLLIPVEARAEDPVIDIELFKVPFFGISIFCAFISYVIVFVITILHPFYLQNCLGFSPSHAGLFMVAFPVTTFIIAPVSGHLSDMIGPKPITVAGLTVLLTAVLLFSTLTLHTHSWYIVFVAMLLGTGHGMFQSPNTSILMSLSPENKLGITGSVNAFSRNIGMVTGITFGISLIYQHMSASAGEKIHGFPDSQPVLFTQAMSFVYLATGVLCLLALFLTVYRVIHKRNT